MAVAIIATVALLYAFCIGVGLAFGAAAGLVRYGLIAGLSTATGILLLIVGALGVSYLWAVAT